LSTVFIFMYVPPTNPACCTVSLPLACYTCHLSCPSPLWYSVLSMQLTLLRLLWRWKHQVTVKHWYLFTNIHHIGTCLPIYITLVPVYQYTSHWYLFTNIHHTGTCLTIYITLVPV
jgi:hypothetical protein